MWGEMGSMGWGWGWGMLGAVHMVLWWVLIVLGIAVLVKWLVGSPRGGGRYPCTVAARLWLAASL